MTAAAGEITAPKLKAAPVAYRSKAHMSALRWAW